MQAVSVIHRKQFSLLLFFFCSGFLVLFTKPFILILILILRNQSAGCSSQAHTLVEIYWGFISVSCDRVHKGRLACTCLTACTTEETLHPVSVQSSTQCKIVLNSVTAGGLQGRCLHRGANPCLMKIQEHRRLSVELSISLLHSLSSCAQRMELRFRSMWKRLLGTSGSRTVWKLAPLSCLLTGHICSLILST